MVAATGEFSEAGFERAVLVVEEAVLAVSKVLDMFAVV